MKAIVILPLVIFIGIQLKDIYASEQWPTVNGVVTSSNSPNRLFGSKYRSSVSYDYTVNGIKYSVNNQKKHKRSDQAKQREIDYPAGKKITVAYDPTNPKNSKIR